MFRTYSVPFANKVAETEIVDWVELIPADDKALEVIGLFIGQTSDVKDEQSEIIPFKVSRGWTTSGSGGTAITPVPLDNIDTAAGFAAEGMNTTLAKEGAEQIIHVDSFNIMVGEKLWLPEGAGWHCSQTQTRLTIRPLTKPVDELVITGTLYVRELT
jgi:hypothetical protein